MTVEWYLTDQLAKGKRPTLVSFWGSDPTNYHNESCGPYIHMDMNNETFTKQSNNGGCSVDSSNEKTTSLKPLQNDAGVDNPTPPSVENHTGTKNTDMPESEDDCRPK